jgi:hypothetical protein
MALIQPKSSPAPSLISWVLGCLAANIVGGFTVFWLLFHFSLGLPLRLLIVPFVAVSCATLLLAPCLYWAQKQDAVRGGHHRRLYLVAGSYAISVSFLYIYFGNRYGLLADDTAKLFYLLAAIGIPAFCFFGFFINKAVFSDQA